MEYSPTKIVNLLKEYDFSIKKKFGQNFIIDEHIIDNIISKSELDKDTLVIEIGPGIGSLTYKLGLNAKEVLAYEIDTTLMPLLEHNLRDSNNVKIVYQDFLKSDIKKDLETYAYKKLYVVANLPYYITTPIIVKIIEDGLDVDKVVIMVQKEVGNRFKALLNSKDYSSLSIYLNYYFDIKKIMDVSPNVFVPKPNIDSIVLELKKKDKLLELKNRDLFFKLVRDSFTQKRKTIRNNLKNYDLVKIEEILKKYNLDLSFRAEQISIDIFVDIANNL